MVRRQRIIIVLLAALVTLVLAILALELDQATATKLMPQSLKNVDGPSSQSIATLQADVYLIQTPVALLEAQPAKGLEAAENSIGYRVAEIERHLHSNERWVGAAAVPVGETHIADVISDTVTPFQVDAGNDGWGTWTQILGTSDTPVISGTVYFNLHRVQVVAVERSLAQHLVQIAYGESGEAAFLAGDYTEFVFQPQSVAGQPTIIIIQDRRIAAGVKCWVRAWVIGQNTGTIDFWLGLHEYEG